MLVKTSGVQHQVNDDQVNDVYMYVYHCLRILIPFPNREKIWIPRAHCLGAVYKDYLLWWHQEDQIENSCVI